MMNTKVLVPNDRIYMGNKCICISDFDRWYSSNTRKFAARFYKHKTKLKCGKDYYKLDRDDFKKVVNIKKLGSSSGYLITESGFRKLVATFRARSQEENEIIDSLNEYFAKTTEIDTKKILTDGESSSVCSIKTFDSMLTILDSITKSVDNISKVKAEQDNLYGIFEKFIENQTKLLEANNKIIAEQAKVNEKLMTILVSVIEKIGSDNQGYCYDEAPIIIKEAPSYAEWKKDVSKAVQLILGVCEKYSDENDVLHSAYDLLRTKYGIVFEQESREYRNKKGRAPFSTKELIYWMETTKETYKNLLIGILNSMYNNAKRGVA